jgi:glycosyltransferase involved in cell wall biosynthesis
MRIAQVAPLYESVPPQLYGGTERVVSFLTESLVELGHDLTLFATADSVTPARLVPCAPQALRLDQKVFDPVAHHFVQLEKVFADAESFDLIHFHIDYLHFPLSRRHSTPHVTTVHGRLDIPDLLPLYTIFSDMPLISISDAQRAPLNFARWQGTVYHGLPLDLFQYIERPGSYLAFLGRISPEKRLDRAIEIAKRSGRKLKVAAKVDNADRKYMETVISPLLDDRCVQFVGEINEKEKQEFLSNAYALLFPIDWPEPFGLVVIEAMACGTPVIAYRNGSVPEIIDEGLTGFIVETEDEAVEAVARVPSFDRRRCRQRFEERFSAARMAKDYLQIYEDLIAESKTRGQRAPSREPGNGRESPRSGTLNFEPGTSTTEF